MIVRPFLSVLVVRFLEQLASSGGWTVPVYDGTGCLLETRDRKRESCRLSMPKQVPDTVCIFDASERFPNQDAARLEFG
jgi:hypothetical protein